MAVKSKKAAKPLKKKGAAPPKQAVRKAAPAAKKKAGSAAKPKAKAKPVARPAAKAKASAKSKVAKKPAKPVKKAIAKAKPAAKAKASVKAKAVAKTKPAPKPAKKAAPAKHVAAPAKHAAPAAKQTVAAKTIPPAKAVARPAGVAPKPRAPRRPRVRPQESGGPVAAWIAQPDQRRPSSFIPAPPRAQSAFSVAAPPASSDRLLRPTDLQGIDQAIRTSPVRVDVEIVNGRTFVSVYPEDIDIRAGEGIEWDFRYLSGTDVMVDDVVIEFTKPAPFKTTTFHAKRPGSGRPHRQLSGAALASLIGQRVTYTVRVVDLYKNELARATPSVSVSA